VASWVKQYAYIVKPYALVSSWVNPYAFVASWVKPYAFVA
jgi:hypothetical protein